MKAAINLCSGQRITLEAQAGLVVLQLTGRPVVAAPTCTVVLTPEECAILTDTISGMGCIAEEQAHELDITTAYAAAGINPRDLAEFQDPNRAGEFLIPAWLRA